MKRLMLLVLLAVLTNCDTGRNNELQKQDGKMGDPVLLAAKQVALEGMWQIARPQSSGYVFNVGTATLDFEGKPFKKVLSGGEGIFSGGQLEGVRISGDIGWAQVHFLVSRGSAGSATREVQAIDIIWVTDSSFEVQFAIDGGVNGFERLKRLASPAGNHDPLTMEAIRASMAGTWGFTQGTEHKFVVVSAGTMTHNGLTYFEMKAGGAAILADEDIRGVRVTIDDISGNWRVVFLVQSTSGTLSLKIRDIQSVDGSDVHLVDGSTFTLL
jgi:hypothetical protein